jgi:hypothetical protein
MKKILNFKSEILLIIFVVAILFAGCEDGSVTLSKDEFCKLDKAVQERDSLIKLTRSIDSIMIVGHVYFTAINDANDRIEGAMPENETTGMYMDFNNTVRDWEKEVIFEYIWTKQLKHYQ